jgi:hypothetical protein
MKIFSYNYQIKYVIIIFIRDFSRYISYTHFDALLTAEVCAETLDGHVYLRIKKESTYYNVVLTTL